MTRRPEPVLFTALIAALVTAAGLFLPSITPEKLAAINAVVVACGALFARSKVTPVE